MNTRLHKDARVGLRLGIGLGGLALAAGIVCFAMFARSGEASHRSENREFLPGQPLRASSWP
jgi:hypothetical protein